jgi:hypothetical protein
MPSTFVILMKRWPEVALIIALALFGSIGIELLGPGNYAEPSAAGAFILIGTMLFYVVQIILQLGFVRTACLEGDKAQEPMELLKAGRSFFWRMVLFGMAYAGMYLAFGFVIFLIVHKIGIIEVKFLEATAWSRNLCFAASSLILVKFILLPPALIIVLDCGLIAAVRLIRRFKISSAREPLVLFVVLQVVTYFAAVLAPVGESEASGNYLYTATFSLTSALIALAISLSTVRFVVTCEPYNKIRMFDKPADINNLAEEDREFKP